MDIIGQKLQDISLWYKGRVATWLKKFNATDYTLKDNLDAKATAIFGIGHCIEDYLQIIKTETFLGGLSPLETVKASLFNKDGFDRFREQAHGYVTMASLVTSENCTPREKLNRLEELNTILDAVIYIERLCQSEIHRPLLTEELNALKEWVLRKNGGNPSRVEQIREQAISSLDASRFSTPVQILKAA